MAKPYPWDLRDRGDREDGLCFMLDSLNSNRKIVDLFKEPYSKVLRWAQQGISGPAVNALNNAGSHSSDPNRWNQRQDTYYTLPMGKIKDKLNDSHTLEWFMVTPSGSWPDGVKDQLEILTAREWLVYWLTIPDNPASHKAAIADFFNPNDGNFFGKLTQGNKKYTIGDYFTQPRSFWEAEQAETGVDYLALFEQARELGVLECHPTFVQQRDAQGLCSFATPEGTVTMMTVNNKCWCTRINPADCVQHDGSQCDGDSGSSKACPAGAPNCP